MEEVYPSMEGAVPMHTWGRFALAATTRVVSVMDPEPTDTRKSVSAWSARNTSPTAVSSGSRRSLRLSTQSYTLNPAALSALLTFAPAMSQVMLSATSTQCLP